MSGRVTSVRLVTLCGCQKFMVVPGSPPGHIEVPIQAEASASSMNPIRLRVRLFRLARLSPDDVSVEADYHEVAEP